ncbi:hypothetical protein BJ928_103162 [Rhizobium sp. WW_1]|jgi:hypothetical protein|nr:hypothetical protein BJ928_103162 [Rhizobium sp. WW_1]
MHEKVAGRRKLTESSVYLACAATGATMPAIKWRRMAKACRRLAAAG